MTKIKIFSNLRFGEIRTATTESGDPLFCLDDLCRVLPLTNVTNVTSILDLEDLSQKSILDEKGRKLEVLFVTEPGMYSVIFRSDSPIAKPFQKWIFKEVLPSLRKGAGYITAHPNEMPEGMKARAAIGVNDTLSPIESPKAIPNIRLALQSGIIEEVSPSYYNKVLLREVCFPITVIAKELGISAEMLNFKLYEAHIQHKVGSVWVLNLEHANKGWAKYVKFDPSIIGNIAMLGSYWWTEEGRRVIHRMFS